MIRKQDIFGELSKDQAESLALKTAKKTRWEDLRYSEKAKLFSYWSIIIMISNIFQITGALMCFYRDIVPLGSVQIFVGIGTFLCWVSITKYIEHSSNISFFSRTIQHAGPNIIRHAINMLPFFIGFGMLGMAIFWPTFRFRDPSIAYFSLFCIMLGDEISNTFQEVMQFDMIFGSLFMFAWVFFSMSVMMNLFMIIVGDSFEVIQEQHKFTWLTDDKTKILDEASKEFDDTSSSSSGSDSDDGAKLPLKKKIKSVLALKDIVERDYEDYVRSNAINGTIVGISDGEMNEEPKTEKENIN